MAALLKCFSNKWGEGRGEEDKSKSRKKCKKCQCRCHKNGTKSQDDGHVVDQCDGKSFSKTLEISGKRRGKCSSQCHSGSCCDSVSDGSRQSYTPISSSPIRASVSPNGTPGFIDNYETNVPGRGYMPVSKDDPLYNMNHPRRGKAVIFNFDRWDNTNIPNLGLAPRLGSEKDKKDMGRCLRKLDFEVEEHDNLKSLDMWAVLERVRQDDHSDADCLVVVVMTHGEKNTVYMRDGTQIPINLIWEYFEAHRCPSLAGKPKIFIVQACRGKQYDSGTKLHPQAPAESETIRSDVTDSSTFSYVIPNAADIIVAFSCPLGHYSWRHPERGSWFIQAICKVFNQHAYDMDIQTLFTTVAREVALNYQSNTTNVESNNKKQVTSTSSTLIRTIIFRPKVPLEVGGRLPIPIAQVIATEEDPSQNDPSLLLQAIHTNINNEDLNTVTSTVAEITEMNLVTNHQLLAQNAINNDNYIVTSN